MNKHLKIGKQWPTKQVIPVTLPPLSTSCQFPVQVCGKDLTARYQSFAFAQLNQFLGKHKHWNGHTFSHKNCTYSACTHTPKVAAAAAAHMRVTGIPALWWPTGCWAARVYKQHEPWGCTSHLSVSPPHAHTPSLSNPYAILPAPKCYLIRLCDTLRASLNSIAVSLCPSLFISSVSPALRRHTVQFHSALLFSVSASVFPSCLFFFTFKLLFFFLSVYFSV